MYRFGDFELDVEGRELRRAGQPVHLEPQAFDLLVHLVDHRDQVVSKIELLDGVWGHRFASEANLTTRVKEARRAVGDDGTSQHTIRNVRGRGYRFVAPVTITDPAAAPLTDALIGREGELNTISDLIGRTRLVTLVGPGGVGKSTLARALALETEASGAHGAPIVELAALDAGSQVSPAVARAVDVVFDPSRPHEAIRSIARLDSMVVLDNCEHVVDDVAALVTELLNVSDGRLRVLATSQVRLGMSAEVVVAVEPLTPAAAHQLFTARARAVLPSWDDDAVSADRVDRLAAGLDRLPLTVEMAAARLATMSFDDLERAIAAGTPLLQLTHRSPTPRHRSLKSIVDWSTATLDPHQHQLLSELSVFAGRVSADDASAVLGPRDAGGVIFDLASLAERSLLVTTIDEPGITRYGMLTTVRTVAARWLDEAGATASVRRRHAEFVLAALQDVDDRLRTSQEGQARRRLADLVDEARAAHQWARTHDPALASDLSLALFHGAYSSLWHEPAEWSSALISDRPPDASPDSLLGARAVVAGAAAHRGDLEAARQEATAIAGVTTGRLHAIALELLADVALYEGDLVRARQIASQLRQLGNELGDLHVAVFGVVDAALALAYAGDPAAAMVELDSFDADPGDLAPTDAAWLAYARGDALSMAGDAEASRAFGEAIELGRRVGNRLVVSVSQTSLANELARVGETDRCLDAYAEALADFGRHGNFTHAVTAIRNFVGLLDRIGEEHGATVLIAAMSSEDLRVSFGAEADRISTVVDRLRDRVGDQQFQAWWAHGTALDLDQAVRIAAEFVDRHRTQPPA